MNRFYDDFESIRAAGHALVDLAIDHLDVTPADPATTLRPARELARAFGDGPPARGRPLHDVLARLRADVTEQSIRLANPMYMGHQVCPPLPVAALADVVVSMLNQSLAVWEMAPAAALLEDRLIRWLAGLAGFGPEAGGSFVSGGSVGNLTALLAARARRFPDAWAKGNPPGLAIVTGAQSHYSIARAAGIMGLGADAVVTVPTTPAGATDPRGVRDAINALRAEGRTVLAIAATAGSTPTGAFDDLDALAGVAAETGVWLHVDGAHGASALLSDRHRDRLRGLERTDSLAWDPHKMLYQPLSTAVVLVRDRRDLENAFRQDAPYLFHNRATGDGKRVTAAAMDQDRDDAPADPGAWTIQCSRRADALRFWIALEYYGTDVLAELFDRAVDITRELYRRILETEDFEALHEPECNILCFRYRARGLDAAALEAFQDRLRARYNASGRGWITATTLDGRRALRVTLINPRTRAEHLERLLGGLREEAAALLATR